MSTNRLSEAQKQQFISDGFTVVSGLVPLEIIVSTCERMCDVLGITLDDPATWPKDERTLPWQTVELTSPCFTPAFDEAASELVGDIYWPQKCISSVLDREGKEPYVNGFIPVLAFPRPGEQRFEQPWPGGYHVDGIHFASLWPDKILLVAMIYLTDTIEYGGATAVVPGSHRQIFEHWVKRGEMPAPQDVMAGIENPQPVPVPGKAGDVILMHYLMAHSGSPNYDNHPRLALNANLTRHTVRDYEKRSGPPEVDWSPLDWTLRTDTIREMTPALA